MSCVIKKKENDPTWHVNYIKIQLGKITTQYVIFTVNKNKIMEHSPNTIILASTSRSLKIINGNNCVLLGVVVIMLVIN